MTVSFFLSTVEGRELLVLLVGRLFIYSALWTAHQQDQRGELTCKPEQCGCPCWAAPAACPTSLFPELRAALQIPWQRARIPARVLRICFAPCRSLANPEETRDSAN